ncbi:hypothetical protein Y048_3789 [Burkholderia pseudomallei MSHR456]|nr:hypothetical protein Y048_3789 [Burkholderia pseudomallei MSHR456]
MACVRRLAMQRNDQFVDDRPRLHRVRDHAGLHAFDAGHPALARDMRVEPRGERARHRLPALGQQQVQPERLGGAGCTVRRQHRMALEQFVEHVRGEQQRARMLVVQRGIGAGRQQALVEMVDRNRRHAAREHARAVGAPERGMQADHGFVARGAVDVGRRRARREPHTAVEQRERPCAHGGFVGGLRGARLRRRRRGGLRGGGRRFAQPAGGPARPCEARGQQRRQRDAVRQQFRCARRVIGRFPIGDRRDPHDDENRGHEGRLAQPRALLHPIPRRCFGHAASPPVLDWLAISTAPQAVR